MGKRDPRVDAYIAKSADFAKPILTELRETVHGACPDVEETMKWSFPHFMYQGMLCSMAAFKQHAVFGFWKGSLIVKDSGAKKSEPGMGQFGRITKPSDLPPKKTLIGYIHKAMALNEEGITVPRVQKRSRKPIRVPPDLVSALRRNSRARTAFDDFSSSHKREYIEWITEAKAKETRVRRLQTAVEWMAQGKSRNWKYEQK